MVVIFAVSKHDMCGDGHDGTEGETQLTRVCLERQTLLEATVLVMGARRVVIIK